MYLGHSEIEEIIRLGGMAPSGGNMQPWKVLVRENTLELSLDPERIGSMLDVGYRASVLAMGSFIENISLSSGWMGLKHEIVIHDFRRPSDLVASIRYSGRDATAERDVLYEQISRRHTNRHLHDGTAVPEQTIDALRSCIVRWPNVRLVAISEEARKQAAAVVLGRGTALLFRHDVLFQQMLAELRWTRGEAVRSSDGVALSTLELPGSAVLLLKVLRACPALRHLLPRQALEKMPEEGVMGCSHLCLLALQRPSSTEALVNAGRALQRLWLSATALELGVQPLTTLPFLIIRAQEFDGAGLSASEARELIALGGELTQIFSLDAAETPLFIFRLSRPAAAASDRALRVPPRSLYSTLDMPGAGTPS